MKNFKKLGFMVSLVLALSVTPTLVNSAFASGRDNCDNRGGDCDGDGVCNNDETPRWHFCPDGKQINLSLCETCRGKTCPDGSKPKEGACLCPDGTQMPDDENTCRCPNGAIMPSGGGCFKLCPNLSEIPYNEECLCRDGTEMPYDGDCNECPEGSHWGLSSCECDEGKKTDPNNPESCIDDTCPDGSYWLVPYKGADGGCHCSDDNKIYNPNSKQCESKKTCLCFDSIQHQMSTCEVPESTETKTCMSGMEICSFDSCCVPDGDFLCDQDKIARDEQCEGNYKNNPTKRESCIHNSALQYEQCKEWVRNVECLDQLALNLRQCKRPSLG